MDKIHACPFCGGYPTQRVIEKKANTLLRGKGGRQNIMLCAMLVMLKVPKNQMRVGRLRAGTRL